MKHTIKDALFQRLNLETGEITPCTVTEMPNDEHSRSIRKTYYEGDIMVSTVFLPIKHPNNMNFETMIFGGEFDGTQERCRTLEEAVKMHERVCKTYLGRTPTVEESAADFIDELKRI